MSFDASHQVYIKYLLPYLFTEGEPEFLHADTLVLRKSFFIIWKHFHYIITDIDKVDKYFEPIPATYHISA